jgi:H+-transporting ATPase
MWFSLSKRHISQLICYKVLAHCACRGHISLDQILPFALVLLIASVPVALPATFILTTSLGAQKLARSGTLVTRLSAGISVRLTNPS